MATVRVEQAIDQGQRGDIGGHADPRARHVHRPQQRLLRITLAQTLGELFGRQAYAVEHLVEQVGLVLEVPVQCPARHPGRPGDLLQRGVCHPLSQKQLFGGLQQLLAGLLGLLFGTTHALCETSTVCRTDARLANPGRAT